MSAAFLALALLWATPAESSSHAVLEVPAGEVEIWTLGQDRILIRTLSPPSQYGNAMLFSGGRAWAYNHAYRQITRLPEGTPPPFTVTSTGVKLRSIDENEPIDASMFEVGRLAGPSGVHVGFEMKTLWAIFHDYGASPIFPGTLSIPSQQGRIMADFDHDWFTAEAHLVISHATWNMDNPLFRLFGSNLVVTRVTETLPLQADLASIPGDDSGRRIETRIRLDRLWTRARTPLFDLTVGRQPITYGTAAIYQTLDRIVPLPPFSIDREYKPGVDAARLDVHLAEATELMLVYALGGDEKPSDARMAAVLRGPVASGEGLLVASLLREMPLFGAGYEIDVSGWTLRGEGSVALVPNALDTTPAFGMATVGFEHAFDFGLDLVMEANYFGFGANHTRDYPAVLYHPRILNGDVPFFFGSRFAGLFASYPISSWLSANSLVSVSLVDGSVYLYPTLTGSIDRAQLIFYGIIPFGARGVHPLQPSNELDLSTHGVMTELRIFFGS
jgi:hypothetical protein